MPGTRPQSRLIGSALGAILISMIGLFAQTGESVADQQQSVRPSDYVVASASCVLDRTSFTLNLVFDRASHKAAILNAVQHALTRDELQALDCVDGKVLDTDEPEQELAASKNATRSLTLVAFAGNLPETWDVEQSTFSADFGYPQPDINIAAGGKWTGRTHDGIGYLNGVPRHPPYSLGYPSPSAFIDCPAPAKPKAKAVASDYLVQVVHIGCDVDSDTSPLIVFLGLGAFASEDRSHDAPAPLLILGAAYLALEYEVHRAVAALLEL